jgi:3-oxo-5-alpha-steroid 4-dehydrogenase 3
MYLWACLFGSKEFVSEFAHSATPRLNSIAILKQKQLVDLLEISLPSAKTAIAIPVFIVASTVQHSCHKHLASLKKYTLPQSRLFHSTVCPHYTSECLIYIALTLLSAPQGQLVNRTVFAGLGFVVSNLAVTADATRTWYVEKFGAEKLKGRWRMVPYLY